MSLLLSWARDGRLLQRMCLMDLHSPEDVDSVCACLWGSPKRDRQMSFEHAFRRAPIKLLLTTWIDHSAYIGGTSLHTRRILLLFFVWPSQTMPEQTIITYLYAKTGIHIFIAEYFDTARPVQDTGTHHPAEWNHRSHNSQRKFSTFVRHNVLRRLHYS